MEITYSWKITAITKADLVENLENVVVHARWTKTGTDELGNQGVFQGATPLSSPNPEQFTAYEDLTEEIVLDWIKSVVVGSYEEHVHSMIVRQINQKRNPTVETNHFPWGGEPEPVTPSPPLPTVPVPSPTVTNE